MNWINYISEINRNSFETLYHSNFSEDTALTEHLKQQFKLAELPEELNELYQQTDGIYEVQGDDMVSEFIWTVQRTIDVNKEMRDNKAFEDLYMSFDQMLFFSEAGNGDYFGFITLNSKFYRNDIFVWNHEDDSRTWVAPNLKTFMEWWLSGKI